VQKLLLQLSKDFCELGPVHVSNMSHSDTDVVNVADVPGEDAQRPSVVAVVVVVVAVVVAVVVVVASCSETAETRWTRTNSSGRKTES